MDETYNEILNAMNEKFESLAGYSADDASDIGIRIKVLAGEIYSGITNAGWIKKQMFPQTATGIQLDYHAQQRGLERKSAVKAAGTLTFSVPSALNYDILIPAGTICVTSRSDSVKYHTKQAATLTAGTLSVNAQAEAVSGGADTNCTSGSISVIVTSVTGISSVTNSASFTGGKDEETDDQLRARILSSYKNISNGTNAAFYKEEALKNESVTSAGVISQERGAGTVNVYIWANGAPSADLIAEVQDDFEELREINVDVQVSAPEQISSPIYISLYCKEGYTFAGVQADCVQMITDYVNSLGIGENFYVVEAGRRLLEVEGVQNYVLRAGSYDKIVTQAQKAVPGTIDILERT